MVGHQTSTQESSRGSPGWIRFGRVSSAVAVFVGWLMTVAACGGGTTTTSAEATTTTGATDTTLPRPTDPITVSSDDGAARLTFSPDALPDGVDPSLISVLRVDPEALAVESPGIAALMEADIDMGPAYELLPAGLIFTEPAQLSIDLDDDAGRVGIGFLVSGDGVELLEPAEDPFFSDSWRPDLVFSIPHFSVVSTAVGWYTATVITPDSAGVGSAFTVVSQVALSDPDAGIDRFVLSGSSSGPSVGSTSLPSSREAIGISYTATGDLVCPDTPVTESITHMVEVEADLPADDIFLALGDLLFGPRQVVWSRVLHSRIECVGSSPINSIAGTYSGTLEIGDTPGVPGSGFSDDYELQIDRCHVTILIQRATQTSTGWAVITVTDDQGRVVEMVSGVRGATDEYTESYQFTLRRDPATGTVEVEGITAGGGHTDEVPPAIETVEWLIMKARRDRQPADEAFAGAAALSSIGWFGSITGTMERTGEPPPCD